MEWNASLFMHLCEMVLGNKSTLVYYESERKLSRPCEAFYQGGFLYCRPKNIHDESSISKTSVKKSITF